MDAKLKKKAYSIAEAARVMSLAPADIEQLIDTGQLTPIFIAKKRLLLATDLDDLLRTYRKVQSTQAPPPDPGGKGKNHLTTKDKE